MMDGNNKNGLYELLSQGNALIYITLPVGVYKLTKPITLIRGMWLFSGSDPIVH